MKRITFKQFIYTYNFRYIADKSKEPYDEDTTIIRIYLPSEDCNKDEWFEFGINNFGNNTWKICERIFSKEILESYIESIGYNEDIENVVTVYLTNNKEVEE